MVIMMKKFSPLALLLFTLSACVLAASGCVTYTFHEKRISSKRPLSELSSMQGETPYLTFPAVILYHGRYGGLSKIEGKYYHRAQFDGFLAGEERYLSVLLPAGFSSQKQEKKRGTFRLYETVERQPGPPNAYLVYTRSRKLREKLDKQLNNLGEGKAVDLDPYGLLKEQFGYRPAKKDYPVVIAVFDTSLHFHDQFFFYYFFWEKGPGKSAVEAFEFDRFPYDEGLKEIRWVKRSRALYTAGLLVYPFCIIADIAMVPVYVVLFPVFIKAVSDFQKSFKS